MDHNNIHIIVISFFCLALRRSLPANLTLSEPRRNLYGPVKRGPAYSRAVPHIVIDRMGALSY